jgi:hypothetical protein
MPTKTDRILGYLPRTFRALPRPNTLYSVVDAFGNELQQAENASASLMIAHWVDLADHGADNIQDLACIAALYGLAPRNATPIPVPDNKACPPLAADETVEQFREHLKRYVRTFLDGTTTVQGIMRIVAEALGLHIADDDAQLDMWWRRGGSPLTDVVARGDDAAAAIFGARGRSASGVPSRAARIAGAVDLREGADVRDGAHLHLAVDGAAPVDVDLSAHANDPPATFAANIAQAIGAALPGLSARIEAGHLVLESRTIGATSSLEFADAADDAATALLGVPRRRYLGRAATGASVTGTVALDAGVDFSAPAAPRYLRLLIDGTQSLELDCAGAPAHKTLAEITNELNAQAGFALASNDGRFLTLSSPSTGFGASVAFESPAGQDATARLFGAPPLLTAGRDAQPARVVGARDGAAGFDLSAGSLLELALDGASPRTIDCAGTNPASTHLNEIVNAINAAVGEQLAVQDGHVVSLRSHATGPTGEIAFLPAGAGDAAATIFGVVPRVFAGAPPARAHLTGKPDLSAKIDVGTARLVRIAFDGAQPRTVDLRAAVPFDPHAKNRLATPEQIADAIDTTFGAAVATTDGSRITLTSPTLGGPGRVAVLPIEHARNRRFVSRAFITDDSASKLFGMPRALAAGTAPSAASVSGSKDLSRGVDLSTARGLRIAVDGGPFVDVDCAAKSARPRAAVVSEIIAAIEEVIGANIASTDGRTLTLTSPTTGPASSLAFAAGGSALGVLFGAPRAVRGTDAAGVVFRGTKDVSGGIDLSAADRLALAVDGGTLVEIACAGPDPAHTSLNQICLRINHALGAAVASSDGKHVVIGSIARGAASGLEIGVPSAADATSAILGVSGGRTYHGADAQPARIVGAALHEPLDLRATRFVGIGVDGRPAADIDLGGTIPAATTLDEVVAAVNEAVPRLASHDGAHLILTSAGTGPGARIEILGPATGDARAALFGSLPAAASGTAPTPAALTGTVDLLAPVNLAEQSVLQLVVDGGAPVEIDVAGTAPDRTALDDIVATINAVVPGLAAATPEARLRLTSPTSGESSRVELRAVRAIEVIEYPPEWRDEPERSLLYGERLTVKNAGAFATSLELTLRAPSGAEGVELVDLAAGLRLRLATTIGLDESIRVAAAQPAGLLAERQRGDGKRVAVSPSALIAAPIGEHAFVPFGGARHLRRVPSGDALVLDDALAPFTVQLRAIGRRLGITARVVEASAFSAPLPDEGGDVRAVGRLIAAAAGYQLVDAANAVLADVRALDAVLALEQYASTVVAVTGSVFAEPAQPPVLVARDVVRLFDVTLTFAPADAPPSAETYDAVAVGAGSDATAPSLATRIAQRSLLVRAVETDKGAVLRLPVGTSSWIFLDCEGARFNRARFDESAFAGGTCREYGVFDASAFSRTTPPRTMQTMFAGAPPLAEPALLVRGRRQQFAPGAFTVNLPADLPDEFGARFGRGRFATAGATPETYDGVVFDPAADADSIPNRVKSALVTVDHVDNVPIGFEGYVMPFQQPRERFLANGTATAPAQLFLTENGVAGYYRLTAVSTGTWGNAIAVTARNAGPARFDLTIGFDGARFENGRITALAGRIIAPSDDPLPALTAQILTPRPVGVLQAKAAGVRAGVSRDLAQPALS